MCALVCSCMAGREGDNQIAPAELLGVIACFNGFRSSPLPGCHPAPVSSIARPAHLQQTTSSGAGPRLEVRSSPSSSTLGRRQEQRDCRRTHSVRAGLVCPGRRVRLALLLLLLLLFCRSFIPFTPHSPHLVAYSLLVCAEAHVPASTWPPVRPVPRPAVASFATFVCSAKSRHTCGYKSACPLAHVLACMRASDMHVMCVLVGVISDAQVPIADERPTRL
ncbi:unnamed protein product [Protopolystoma xenopodis]|uniref:Uncharacterized protein n=1 Tax=Protopolystoma xenopodis TaxID=117903 RepID=A0A3S5B7E8_9PLAT|nr:unnamed protein product [Protopolystoma xenopodis]